MWPQNRKVSSEGLLGDLYQKGNPFATPTTTTGSQEGGGPQGQLEARGLLPSRTVDT